MIFDLGLGSNLGDRMALLQSAVNGLRRAGCEVIAVSRVYETEPVGGPEQRPYLNAAVRVTTDRTAREMLELAHDLENAADRVRTERWGPRTLDVDILRAGDLKIVEPDLEIPHPRMRERAFVMVPLADIDPSIDLAESVTVDLETVGREEVAVTAHRLL